MYETAGKTFKDLALDINFWRHLNPELTLTEYSRSDWGPYKLSAQEKKEIRESLIEEGYFHLNSVFAPEELKKLADAVEVLHREQWPTVFAFVYDEFWHIQNRYREILTTLLGKDHKLMPNIWVLYINPDIDSKGWEPHRDRQKIVNLRPDGTPLSINLWTPLTDASPLNGCMYALPAHRDNNYWTNPNLTTVDDLQDIRALPAPVGSVLGWNETVFHWGARASKRASEPRIAIASVFQSTECGAFETPLLPVGQLIPFKMRVGLIAQQFSRFIVQNSFSPAVEKLTYELAPFFNENVRILDDGWRYWDIITDEVDSPRQTIEKTASNQLPTPPKGFEKGRSFKSTYEEIRQANNDADGNDERGEPGKIEAHSAKDADDKSETKGWLEKLGLK